MRREVRVQEVLEGMTEEAAQHRGRGLGYRNGQAFAQRALRAGWLAKSSSRPCVDPSFEVKCEFEVDYGQVRQYIWGAIHDEPSGG